MTPSPAASQQQPHRQVLAMAWPMILANISVPLLGLVDTALLGHLEDARYLGAVAVGTALLSFLYWGFGFLRMGTTGASAQALGGDDAAEPARVLLQSAILGLAIAAGLWLASAVLLPLGLALMEPPPASRELALTYLQIRLCSAPAVLFNYAVTGWLIGQQRPRWPLLIAVVTNGLNIVLDWLFIWVLGMNSDGAAIASVISEYAGAGLALLAVRAPLSAAPLSADRLRALWRDARYRRFLADNAGLFVRTAALLFAFAFFTAQGARLGPTVLAANAILLNLMLLAAYGLDGFAHAAEALVGEAVGRRDLRRFKRMCWHCLQWSLVTAALMTAVFWLGRDSILALMTDLAAVRTVADAHYPWLLALPLVAVWSYLLDGIFIGAMQTRWMQHSMLLSVFGVYLPLWYLGQGWGNHGLWLAFTAFNLARGLSLGAAFYYLSRGQRWWPAHR